MATSIGSYLSTGLKTLAFSALEKSDTLNSIANRLSGGKINRDTLAQSVLRDAIQIGFDYAASNKSLGERHSRLLPAIRQAAIDNDHEQMQAGVKKLMEKLVPEGWQETVGNLITDKLGDHALEKVLATTVQQYGRKPLEDYIKGMVGGRTGGDFVARQIMAILDRAVLSKTEFQQGDSALYRLMAKGLDAYLTGKPEDPPGVLSRVLGAVPVVTSTVQTVRNGIDQLGENLGQVLGETVSRKVGLSPTETTDVREVHSKAIERFRQKQEEGLEIETDDLPMLFHDEITDQVKPREVLSTLVARQCVSEGVFGTEGSAKMMEEQTQELRKALDSGRLSSGRREELEVVAKMVNPEQTRPLGERGGTEVGYTLTGRMARVETVNHAYMRDDVVGEVAREGEEVLDGAPTGTKLMGGWNVSSRYAEHAGTLNLDLPDSSYGYTDMALQGVNTLWSTGWSMMGWSKELSVSQESELRSLSNLCGNDPRVLETVTRYLDPDLARRALAEPTLRHMRDPETGLVGSEGRYLKLEDGEPEIRFSVQHHDPLISISMQTVWRVERYGADPQSLREPIGDKPCTLSSVAVITLRPGTDGAPPTVSHNVGGVVATIGNVVAFDSSTGSLRTREDESLLPGGEDGLQTA
ncbi:hypothetical protein ABRY97_06780 [Castellaniella ginsengisoli]|uniref:Uncharacterized protein n=1 Tax=Castellaniella ginsengisoli TaxID=546114 RepID=A0AB39F6I6_9BURK